MVKKIMATALMLSVCIGIVWLEGRPGQTDADRVILLRMADDQSADYPTNKANYEFARLVKERSGGRIIIEVYPGAQLGDERAVIEQLQFGGIDLTRVSLSPLTAFSPQMRALQMPYLYRNSDHMWNVLKSEVGDEFLNSLESGGYVGLAWYDAGARSFYNTKREVKSLGDLAGLKIRVQENELMIGLVNALGAVATPMPFGEVYSALQTGVVDGAENSWSSYFATSHYEVAKYYTVDEHTRVPEVIIASKRAMDKLSKEDQAMIRDAAREAMDFEIQAWADFEKAAIDAIRANGNTITCLDDNAEFQKAMQPLYDELPDELKDAVVRIRAVK